MTNQRMIDPRNDASRPELTEDQLDKASGGKTIVTPRDSVSGNATGRRAYKAVE